jgi:hypothetical protein
MAKKTSSAKKTKGTAKAPKKTTKATKAPKKTAKPAAPRKVKKPVDEEEDDDEELIIGDDEEEDDDEDDEDLDEIEDEMLAEDEDGPGRSPDQIRDMMWEIDCPPCDGHKPNCQVKRDFGCPPGKGD